jgi:pimeloyl-ACP methyl ester carboxylesterase
MKLKMSAVAVVVALFVSACGHSDATPFPSNSLSANSLEDYYAQELVWEDCDVFFECATVVVPMDYAEPAGDTVNIAVSRHLADKPAKRAGALFMNPGGPGGSGIEYLRSYESQFTNSIIDQFDLIGFDPRGVNLSSAVTCFTDEELDEYAASEATPDTPAEVDEFFELGKQVDENCFERTGDLLSHVSTVEAAKDLDVLRAVMGEAKLNYLGKSYGTQLGAVYAVLFPENIGNMVLDGAVDFTLSTKELSLGQAKGFDLSLSRFARYCIEAAIVCDLGDSETEILQNIKDLLDRLDQEPMKTSDPDRPLSESQAWNAILGAMYAANGGWDWLIEGLSMAFRGKGSELLNISDWFWGREYDGYSDNSVAANIAINCADFGPSGLTPQDIEAEFVAAAPFTGKVLAWSEGGCEGWPGGFTPLPQDLNIFSNFSIVVIGTTYDPATPDEWARALASKLGIGVYINFNGDGHTGYMSGSTDLDNVIDDFFLYGMVPTENLSYEPDWPLLD